MTSNLAETNFRENYIGILDVNGSEFKAWRESFGLTQADVADKFGVTRTTIQNWEAQPGPLTQPVENGCKVWDRRLRQIDPVRGPVTLIYADGPMFIDPYGPRRRIAMMKQEPHPSNAAVLARVQVLASSPNVYNPFVMEDAQRDLWNMVELQRAIDGEDEEAPTLPNLLQHLAAGLRADAPSFVRTGPKLATEQEVSKRVREIGALATELERIADQSVLAIVGEQNNAEAVMVQARSLGVRPRDPLVNALAQAFVAARLPTDSP
jgi:DNA-binding XRE family transcriptional regulator